MIWSVEKCMVKIDGNNPTDLLNTTERDRHDRLQKDLK